VPETGWWLAAAAANGFIGWKTALAKTPVKLSTVEAVLCLPADDEADDRGFGSMFANVLVGPAAWSPICNSSQ